jgi:formylglycine-generating enzyme
VLLLAGLPACTAVSGFGDLEKVPATATTDSATVTVDSATTDTNVGDTSIAMESSVDTGPISDSATMVETSVVDTGTDAGSFTCPSGTKGPTMVNVGGYCIDSTEVTTTQYSAFLVAKGSDTSGQPAECAWNTSYTPLFWPQTGLELHPVMGLDWCDARAYCAWAGKRLCGKIGGGAAPFSTPTSATASQWYRACSFSGARTYPYGSGYVAAACQDGSIKPAKTVPAGTKLGCEGGYTGLFDMSGEVQEWEDSCDGTSGTGDSCHVRGGMIYDATPSDLTCATPRALARNTKNDHTGFRCCSP